MEIIKGLDIVDLSLYLREHKTLVIADAHIGFEEALNKQGLMIPRFQFKEIVNRINNIIHEIKKINDDKNVDNKNKINNKNNNVVDNDNNANIDDNFKNNNKNNNNNNDKIKNNNINDNMINKNNDNNDKNSNYSNINNIDNIKNNKKNNNDKNKINTIIINGDIKHEFGEISKQEWRETLKIIDLLQKNCQKLILIKGNHDNILGPIADKKGIEIIDYHNIDNVYICHGHKIPTDADFAKSKTIIIGHEHPALSLKQGSRVELYKCFLKGKYKNKSLVVMPSLNLVTEGTDVMKESLLSPFLQQDLKSFEAYLIADKTYYFGRLGGLK